jgi:hypothetical protein
MQLLIELILHFSMGMCHWKVFDKGDSLSSDEFNHLIKLFMSVIISLGFSF